MPISLSRLSWLVRCAEWAEDQGHRHVLLIGRPRGNLVDVEPGLAGVLSPEPPPLDLPQGLAVAAIPLDTLAGWLQPFRQMSALHG